MAVASARLQPMSAKMNPPHMRRRSVLRHIRVASKQELKDRLMAAMDYFNSQPVGAGTVIDRSKTQVHSRPSAAGAERARTVSYRGVYINFDRSTSRRAAMDQRPRR